MVTLQSIWKEEDILAEMKFITIYNKNEELILHLQDY